MQECRNGRKKLNGNGNLCAGIAWSPLKRVGVLGGWALASTVNGMELEESLFETISRYCPFRSCKNCRNDGRKLNINGNLCVVIELVGHPWRGWWERGGLTIHSEWNGIGRDLICSRLNWLIDLPITPHPPATIAKPVMSIILSSLLFFLLSMT